MSKRRESCCAMGHTNPESFREWLFAPILQKIEEYMSKTFSDLNVSISANTAATDAAVAAFNAASGQDFTAQTTAIDANTAKLKTLAGGAPAGTFAASPPSVSLSSVGASQAITLQNGSGQLFQASSDNTAVATVSPASSNAPSFTVTAVAPGSTNIKFNDAQNNTASVPVTVS